MLRTSIKRVTLNVVFPAFCFLLTISLLGFQISAFFTCDNLDLTEVSGFYGPGTYLAWLVAAAASVGPYEWLSLRYTLPSAVLGRHIEVLNENWHIHPGLINNQPQNNKIASLDGPTFAAIAYPATAAFDMMIRAFKHDFGASYEAAARVTQLGTCIACVCFVSNTFQEQVVWCWNVSSRRRMAWTGLWLLCLTAFCVKQIVRIRDTFLGIVSGVPLLDALCIVALPHISPYQPHRLFFRLFMDLRPLIIIFITCFGAVFNETLTKSEDGCWSTFGSIFPQSTSKLSDMDQVTALVFVVGGLLFNISHIKLCKHLVSKSLLGMRSSRVDLAEPRREPGTEIQDRIAEGIMMV
ncbi:hypothetical protein B0J13DRAFT_558530 [Dactylonectria estremocensis]|uniref:Uncharacterized protein n=1 Tax=Dactylonectria estremocensis TaxID=1079267 RepID=A0A9P9EHV0_9HYPO|nr:hypothetical protein B0J13DRAFT_558530 [Dactylonectria estremocensis]